MRHIFCAYSTAPVAPNPVAPLPAGSTPTVVPPLPQLPPLKTAYPAPPPPPQVFIIKENSISAKDPEESKSAEALDNLSQSFENAFTKALKSQRTETKLRHKPRKGRVNQSPEERENLDSEDEASENEENEDDEEKVQFYGGSRGDMEDDDIKEDNDISQENDNDDDNDSEDDNNDDQIKADEEPPYDLDQPRYSHSRSFNEDDEDLLRHDQKDQPRKRKKYLGLQQYDKDEDLRDKKADRHQLPYHHSKSAFSNRYVERQGPWFHSHREKHPTLKTTSYDDRSQEYDSDSTNGEITQKVPSEVVTVSSRRQKVRFRHFKSQKPRSKFKVYAKKHPKQKTTSYDDRSPGYDIDSIYYEGTQNVPSEPVSVSSRRHKVVSKHVKSQKRRSKFKHYSKNLSVSHDTSNFAHLQDRAPHKHGRMHGRDHHTSHKQSKKVTKSHSKTEMIPEEEITEDIGSASEGNDYSGDDKRVKSFKTLSSSGNYKESNSHRPLEDNYIGEHKKPALTTVQVFKPGRRPKFSKSKKFKSDNTIKEDVSYSSGEESGENENNDTDGDEHY